MTRPYHRHEFPVSYKPLTEKEEWERHGCANRQEWRELLNEALWSEHTPKLK